MHLSRNQAPRAYCLNNGHVSDCVILFLSIFVSVSVCNSTKSLTELLEHINITITYKENYAVMFSV